MATAHWKNRSLKNLTCVYEGITYIEEWKPIIQYEGLYEISNFGRVKSLPKPQNNYKPIILRIIRQSLGYCVVTLYNKKGQRIKRVHIMVAKHFIPNPHILPQVNHLKGVKTNNAFYQIEWSTPKQNIEHSIKIGLRKQKGQDGCNAQLTNKQALQIFKSSMPRKKICEKFNINITTVDHIKIGRSYSCVTGKNHVKAYKQIDGPLALRIYRSKGSNMEIAEKFGVRYLCVYRIKNGINHSASTGHVKK